MFSVYQVRSHGESKVTVSYKYIIQDHLQSLLESNLVQEDAIFYEWALKKWSHCSKPCGGGTQLCCCMTVCSSSCQGNTYVLLTVIYGCQGNSTQGLAAGERQMGKWFTGCSAPTLTNQEPSTAAATLMPATLYGNQLQVILITQHRLPW